MRMRQVNSVFLNLILMQASLRSEFSSLVPELQVLFSKFHFYHAQILFLCLNFRFQGQIIVSW